MFKNSALIGATLLTWCGLSGCSDPVPPSPEAALSTTIERGGVCTSGRGPLSLGEPSNTLLTANVPGDGRVVDGTNGSVSCTVASNGTGFQISADIDGSSIELGPGMQPYTQKFTIRSTYPGLMPNLPGATASITSTDSQTQSNREDSACSLTVTSFGSDGTGGALFARFECPNFADPNTPGTECVMTGVVVLENCNK